MSSDVANQAVRQLGMMAEVAAAAGVISAMAVPRFFGALVHSNLSQTAGFNVGWIYVAGAAFCVFAAIQYFQGISALARQRAIHVKMKALARDLGVFTGAGFVAGYAFVMTLDRALPAMMLQLKLMGVSAMMPTLAITLVPLLALLLSFRIWVPRWANDHMAVDFAASSAPAAGKRKFRAITTRS